MPLLSRGCQRELMAPRSPEIEGREGGGTNKKASKKGRGSRGGERKKTQNEKQKGRSGGGAGAQRLEARWPRAGLELAVLFSLTSDTGLDAFPECNREPRPSLGGGACQSD